MKHLNVLAVALAAAVVLAAPSFAHHSFAAEFDAKKCRDFTGTLTKLDWQNPHPYFFVDVKDAGGKVENWSFQTYSPITLRRTGTDRQVFLDNIGKEVWVRGCLAQERQAELCRRRHAASFVGRRAAPGRSAAGLDGVDSSHDLQRSVLRACVRRRCVVRCASVAGSIGASSQTTAVHDQAVAAGRTGAASGRRPSRLLGPLVSERRRPGVSAAASASIRRRTRQFDPKVTPEDAAGIPALGAGEDQVDDADRARAVEVVGELHAARRSGHLAAEPVHDAASSTSRDCWCSCTRCSTTGASFTSTDARCPRIPEPFFHGNSTARWEGDTLVVESIGFDERTYIMPNGWFHSDELRSPSATRGRR